MSQQLFLPYKERTLSLKNRMVMAPMTRCRAAEGNVPTPLMAEYYAQRATAGLIITEGVPVSEKARGYLWTPGIYTRDQIDGWAQVADAVHEKSCQIYAQIWHTGRVSHTSLQPGNQQPEGATDEAPEDAVCFAYDEDGNPGNVPISTPVPLDTKAIERVISEFVRAALNARKAGMDGVEIHAANGYLFDQFLNSVVNTRDDRYGGPVENRCRLLLETVDAVSEAIGAERTGVRISPNGKFNSMPEDPLMEETFIYLANELEKRKISYLHINDQGTFGLPPIPDELMLKIRAAFSGPVILCGGYDAQRAQDALATGLADLVAFGTSYLANPDLPARLQNGWPLNQPDMNTFYGGGAEGYTDYPVYEE